MLGVGAQSQKTGHPTNHAAKFAAKMRHITCTGIYLCASKDYWLSSGGSVMDSQVLVSDHAAIEAAYIVTGLIEGVEMTPAEQKLFKAAASAAKSNLPAGQIRWTEEGKLTNGARHLLIETLNAVQHLMLNG
jgi:predicted metal-dependent phosphotriesterase family hydrolase